MSQFKLKPDQLLAFITILIMIFGTGGFGLIKINKMVSQEEFNKLQSKVDQMVSREEFNKFKCRTIKKQKIEKEQTRALLLQDRNDTLQYPKLQEHLMGILIEMNDFIDDRKIEYIEYKCLL